MAELDMRQDLIPAFAGKSDDPTGYLPHNDSSFHGSFEAYARSLKKLGTYDNVYKLCSATSKKVGYPTYAPLSMFKQTSTGWEGSLSEALRAEQRETCQAFREKNLPFIRMYMMGNVETNIVCPLTGQQVDAWVFDNQPINIWEQHHFKVRNRASIQKELADPGEILRSMDFTLVNGNTLEAIKDMMRTVFLSPTAHKAVHNAWNNSDIRNYRAEQRPWALQNCSNWDAWMAFLDSYGYPVESFGPFGPWITSLELTDTEMAK